MNKYLTTGESSVCCGCRACEQICPAKCISMSTDTEGFIVPKIDLGKCINCNSCSRVCPVENPEDGKMPLEIYATASSDLKTKLRSSSGGIFYLLAKNIIEQVGLVAGASLDLEKRYLQHNIVDSLDNLYSLLGSKYIASDTGTTFSDVKRMLSEGRKVLYVGTPCQIAGLKKYIKTDSPYLYTCDLLCHGVPSQYVFEQYIDYLERKHKGRVVNWNFRDKEKYGWSITLRFDINQNGRIKTFNIPAGLSPYFYGFLRGKFLRESCYHCPYAKLQRTGDLTLADFWGGKELNLSADLSKGCSCVLVNTAKGKELFNAISYELQFIHQVTYEQAYRQNINFRKPCKRPLDRDSAILDIRNNTFEYVVKKYCKNPRETRIRIKLLLKAITKYFRCSMIDGPAGSSVKTEY